MIGLSMRCISRSPVRRVFKIVMLFIRIVIHASPGLGHRVSCREE